MEFGVYILFTLVILLFFGIWLRRLVVGRLQPRRILGDLESEIQRMVRDINSAGDRNVSVLEDRIESLKTLMRRADVQIEEMEQRLGEIEAAKEESLTIPFRREQPTTGDAIRGETLDQESTPRDHIIALHDEGVPSEVIASRMGIAIGEVELIIALTMNRPRR